MILVHSLIRSLEILLRTGCVDASCSGPVPLCGGGLCGSPASWKVQVRWSRREADVDLMTGTKRFHLKLPAWFSLLPRCGRPSSPLATVCRRTSPVCHDVSPESGSVIPCETLVLMVCGLNQVSVNQPGSDRLRVYSHHLVAVVKNLVGRTEPDRGLFDVAVDAARVMFVLWTSRRKFPLR